MKTKINLSVIIFSVVILLILSNIFLSDSGDNSGIEIEEMSQYSTPAIEDKALLTVEQNTPRLQLADVFANVNNRYKDIKEDKAEVKKISQLVGNHISGIQHNLEKLIADPNNALAKQLIEGEVIELANLHDNSLEILKQSKSDTTQLSLVSSRFNGIINLLDKVAKAKPEDVASRATEALAWTQKHRRKEAPMADDQPTFTTEFTPIRSEEDITEGTPPTYATKQNNDTAAIVPLENANGEKEADTALDSFSIFSSAHAATLQAPTASAASCAYNSADLAPSLPEVAFTPEIMALAESLEYSPVRIYEYLKNEIEYDPYYGSIKGASMTLKSGSGNATDQASLFIALLRYSGFPARYVKGEIYFADDDSRGVEWMGAKTVIAAQTIYSKGHGVAGRTDNGGFFLRDHVWVESCVPYANYRSTDGDISGYSWLPLDVSFKEMEFVQGTVVPNGFQFDYDALLAERHIQKPLDILIQQIEAATGTAVDGFGYQGTIKKKEIDILPSTLPYRVVRYISWEDSTSSETATLPANHKYKVELSLFGRGLKFDDNETPNDTSDDKIGKIFKAMYSSPGTLLLSEILDKPLTLSSRPLIGEDTSTWNNWISGSDNNSSMICDIDLVPELFVGENKISMGSLNVNSIKNAISIELPHPYNSTYTDIIDACSRNYKLKLKVTINGNDARKDVTWSNIQPLNDHAIQVYGYHTTDKYIDSKINQLLNTIGGSTTDFDITQKGKLETFLDIVGLKFMNNASQDRKSVGQLYGANGLSGLHVGLVSSRLQVNYLFDLPLGISGAGFLVDVPGGVNLSADLTTGGFNLDSFLLAGFSTSAEESYIWQELAYLDAVSTVRGIQFANEQYASDSTKSVFRLETSDDVANNLNVNCPTELKYSTQQINDFESILASDPANYMRIPECKILYDDWRGTTYFAFTKNGSSFGARYAISGDYVDGANGGYTTGNSFSSRNLTTIQTAITPSSFGFVGGSSNLVNEISVPPSSIAPGLGSIWAPDQFLSIAGGNTGTGSFSSFAGDPVNLLSGNMYHQETDIDIAGRGGLNLTFERHYNSHNRKDGPLGIGWTHNFNQSLIFNDDDADANSGEGVDSDGMTSSIVWKDSSGALIVFENVAVNSSGVVNSNQTFSVIEGKHITAKRLSNGVYEVKLKGGLKLQFQPIAGTVSTTAKLTKIIDRNNNQLTISYDSSDRIKDISDQLNRKLNFDYIGSSQHIALISDWTGRLFSYEYDTNNHLVKYKNPLASKGEIPPITYDYYPQSAGVELAHAMKSITDAGGSTMTWQYYLNGKVFRTINEEGNTFSFTYNILRRETETINEKGQKEIILFNEFGRMIKKTYADGAFEEWKYESVNPNLQTEYRGTDGLKIKYQYDGNENISKIIFPSGNYVQKLNYNAFARPQKIRTAKGNYKINNYYVNGLLKEEIHLKKGVNTNTPTASQIVKWSKYSYNNKGDLLKTTQVTDFNTQTGATLENVYSTNGLTVNEIKYCGSDRNNDGIVDACDYDRFQYDSLGRVTVSESKGKKIVYNYSELNEVVKIKNVFINGTGITSIEERNFNENSLLERVVKTERDSKNLRIIYQASYIYDSMNRLSESVQDAYQRLIYTYDPLGNIVSVSNEKNEKVQFQYDNRNRKIVTIDREGKLLEKQSYGASNYLKESTNASNKKIRYVYYGAEEDGRLKEKHLPNGIIKTYSYDADGNVLMTSLDALTNPGLPYQINYEYDELNRITQTIGPEHNSLVAGQLKTIRNVTDYLYDMYGNVSSTSAGYSEMGAAKQAMKQLTKDRFEANGLLLESEDQLGFKTRYFYNINNNLKKTVYKNNFYTKSTYDSSQLVTKEATYNNADNLVINTTYTRSGAFNDIDEVNQTNYQVQKFLLSNERTSIVNTIDYIRDFDSQIVGISNDIGEHNSASVQQVKQPFTYKYDADQKLTTITDSAGKVTKYSYDFSKKLASIKLSNGVHLNFVYDNKGRLVERKFSTGYGTNYSYDVSNNITLIRNYKTNGVEISRHTYTYDWLGRKISAFNSIRGVSGDKSYLTNFQYDRKNRLSSEIIYFKNGWNQSVSALNSLKYRSYSYTYEVFDNLKSKVTQCFANGINKGRVDYTFSYNAGGQLSALDHKAINVPVTGVDCDGFRNHGWQSVSYTYDNHGNIKSEQTASNVLNYTYDALDRLQTVKGTNIKDNPVQDVYEYDFQNRRVRKVTDNKELLYFYSGDHVVATLQKNKGEVTFTNPVADVQYIYAGLDIPIASINKAGNINYFYQDGFNSVIASVNQTGVLNDANLYTAWGEKLLSEGATSLFGYTGREEDASGLLYYRNRYYNPFLTRFTQPDPAGFKDALNLYSYVGNSPTLFTDPFGLSAQSATSIQNNSISNSAGYVNGIGDIAIDIAGSNTGSSRIDSIVKEFITTASEFKGVLAETSVGAVFAPPVFAASSYTIINALAFTSSVQKFTVKRLAELSTPDKQDLGLAAMFLVVHTITAPPDSDYLKIKPGPNRPAPPLIDSARGGAPTRNSLAGKILRAEDMVRYKNSAASVTKTIPRALEPNSRVSRKGLYFMLSVLPLLNGDSDDKE